MKSLLNTRSLSVESTIDKMEIPTEALADLGRSFSSYAQSYTIPFRYERVLVRLGSGEDVKHEGISNLGSSFCTYLYVYLPREKKKKRI